MQKSILAFVVALALVLTVSGSFAQSVEVTKKKMKTTEMEKSTQKKDCCAGMDGASCDEKNMKKEVRVIKEKNDETGRMVTKVTIQTVKDGVKEEKTLEGAEAEKYVEEMDKDNDMDEHHDADDDKKFIKKKIMKEVKKVEETKESKEAKPKN
jgi:hypothetical protein